MFNKINPVVEVISSLACIFDRRLNFIFPLQFLINPLLFYFSNLIIYELKSLFNFIEK